MKNCERPIPTVPGQQVITCMNSNIIMIMGKCPCRFNCVLTFSSISLLLLAEATSDYYQGVMKQYQRENNALKEMLCFLEHVNHIYNSKIVIMKVSNN